jgi:hypothetical protein
MAKATESLKDKSARLSEGAKKCKDCGNAPHGMEQQGALGGRVITYYEVGCLVCRDHRAQGQTREEAVKNWNAGEFLPPKKEG